MRCTGHAGHAGAVRFGSVRFPPAVCSCGLRTIYAQEILPKENDPFLPIALPVLVLEEANKQMVRVRLICLLCVLSKLKCSSSEVEAQKGRHEIEQDKSPMHGCSDQKVYVAVTIGRESRVSILSIDRSIYLLENVQMRRAQARTRTSYTTSQTYFISQQDAEM